MNVGRWWSGCTQSQQRILNGKRLRLVSATSRPALVGQFYTSGELIESATNKNKRNGIFGTYCFCPNLYLFIFRLTFYVKFNRFVLFKNFKTIFKVYYRVDDITVKNYYYYKFF